jgi:hypothetical protein
MICSCDKDSAAAGAAAQRLEQERASSSPTPSGDASDASAMMDQLRASCPMVVQGAEVAVIDTEGGVALTFTTEGGDVADLRTRVERMSQLYTLHQGRRGMMWHPMGRGMGGGMGRGMGDGMGKMTGRGPMPAASATMTEADAKMRLELRPTDPAQLDALREHVRWHQQRMESGECWMSQDQPDAAPSGEQR